MKIGLLGYGKMGKAIEALALQQGHEVVLRINSANASSLTPENLQLCHVAIEFSRPEVAFSHVKACLEAGVPVVCGTTGWQAQLPKAKEICQQYNGAFLYASNFSIGVNLFFALSRFAAKLMNAHPEYRALIEETHHTQKVDAPSGTAITLAEEILDVVDRYQKWQLNGEGTGVLPVLAHRLPDVTGTHSILWQSELDSIELKHTAYSRVGFANGALLAAQWLLGKKGIFTMQDVLGL